MRRAILSVIGDAGVEAESSVYRAALEVGRLAVDAGFRVMTGGLGGVMEAASQGAHRSSRYREGDTIGVLPELDPAHANPWVDIVLATGLGHARNTLVANADAIVAVGGGAGTLSEIAFAWMFKRLIVTVPGAGWAARLGDQALDGRVRSADPEDRVYAASDPAHAMQLIVEKLPLYAARSRGFRSSDR
jgi:hypothetical protein